VRDHLAGWWYPLSVALITPVSLRSHDATDLIPSCGGFLYVSRQHATRAFALCVALACVAPTLAYGAPSASVQQQAVAAKARIASMEQQLSSAMSAYDSAASSLDKTRAEIKANKKHLKELNSSVKQGQKRLDAEVNFLYRSGGNGFTEALLTAPTIDAFASRLLALSRIASRDAEVIGKIKRDRAEATKLAKTLAEREREQAAQVAQVASRRAKAQAAVSSQQAYVDSLSKKVAAQLDAGTTAAGPKTHTSRPVNRSAIAWATVEGRNGRYAVLGGQPKRYKPSGIKFTGNATWYGNVRPNMRTSSGRAFNENELTCAHKTLPFGTRVAVNYGGRRVIVTVTDRGPFGKGRVIDLTKRAASIIGLKSAGVGHVTCEVVRPQ
jgi:rare lipoprotein A (peptidoglycan hydrolase)